MRMLLLSLLCVSACVPAGRHRALATRVAELEDAVERVGTVVAIPASASEHDAAQRLLDGVTQALVDEDQHLARARIDDLVQRYPRTRAARSLTVLRARLAVLDGPVGAFDGEVLGGVEAFDPEAPYFVVFLSTSCAGCATVAAHAAEVRAALGDTVQVVGMLAADDVPTYLAADAFPPVWLLPVLVDGGTLRSAIGAFAPPHAALVVDGRVVWVGDHLGSHAAVVARHALPPQPSVVRADAPEPLVAAEIP